MRRGDLGASSDKGAKRVGFFQFPFYGRKSVWGALWCSVGGGYQVAAGHSEREGSGFEQEASSGGRAPPAPRQLAVSLDKANKYFPPYW
jgi:hypothetical protein